MIFKNIRLVDPANGRDFVTDVEISDGKIKSIEKTNKTGIDMMGKIMAPGFIDAHVHFRDPGQTEKEDIETGSMAAARGGFTSVICMANTRPVMDSKELIEDFVKRASELKINVYTVSALTKGFKGSEIVNMEENLEAGAVAFTDDGIPDMRTDIVKAAMEKAKELDAVISFHEEDPNLIKENGVNHGKVSEELNIYGSPRTAEDVMVARDGALSLYTGAKVVIQHISSGVSVDLVRFYKSHGARLYAEVTPHHFTLTEDAVLEHGTRAKMNPPLRTEEDREKILNGIADGTIDMIATDHAPHTKEEKDREIVKAPSGITGLETAFSLANMHLLKKGIIDLKKLVEIMSTNAAKLYNIPGGEIKVGEESDFVIFDTTTKWKFEESLSKSKNTPFLNEEMEGKIWMSFAKGKIAYIDKDLKID
ncbi:dihydroorotase [Peptoniphilus sp.]|uniref:dihydroorotase n=1 Tax=Peptoniphilus sp. TaxID=1971214 RepID=UPI0039911FF8